MTLIFCHQAKFQYSQCDHSNYWYTITLYLIDNNLSYLKYLERKVSSVFMRECSLYVTELKTIYSFQL